MRIFNEVLQILTLFLVTCMFWNTTGVKFMNHILFWKINDPSKRQVKQRMHRQARVQ